MTTMAGNVAFADLYDADGKMIARIHIQSVTMDMDYGSMQPIYTSGSGAPVDIVRTQSRVTKVCIEGILGEGEDVNAVRKMHGQRGVFVPEPPKEPPKRIGVVNPKWRFAKKGAK